MYPLFFRPIFKRTLWGGRRLGELLGKSIGAEADYAESWEIVDHGEDQSVVENGPLAGQSLGSLLRDRNAALLGRHAGLEAFPLLLKFLDCHRVLSVQVHPDDAYAQQMHQPDLGKTEAWYIVAAEPDSQIYAGLRAGVDRQTLEQAIAAGETEQVLHAFTPVVGQCVFIPAGTVHALGAGLVVAELQQSSDTTFRLFDWNRVDANGQGRPLHVQQALDVTDFSRGPVAAQTPIAAADGTETLVACGKFVLAQARFGRAAERVGSGSDPDRECMIGGDERMHLLTVVQGGAELMDEQGQRLALPLGRSAMLPAAAGAVRLRPTQPDTTVLLAHLP
mgnify:CR=1 FL=1